MKVVILGAAGKTGLHLVKQALAGRHDVVAFMRSNETLPIQNSRLRVQVGDARNVQDLCTAFAGQQVVISALGSNKLGDDLITESTQALIDAAQQSNVTRIIMMSSFVVTPNFKQTGLAKIVRWLMKGIIKDKTSGEALLKQSDLDWTIVYATRLDGVPRGSYRVVSDTETVSAKNAIARADVAEFMIKQLENSDSIRKSVLITSK